MRALDGGISNCRANHWMPVPFVASSSGRLTFRSKNDKIGDRQRDMAKKFYQAGLLSRQGLEAVDSHR